MKPETWPLGRVNPWAGFDNYYDNPKNKIKLNYKTQFPINPMLKDEIEKQSMNNRTKIPTRVTLQNPRPELWDQNNPIKNKSKQIMKPKF